MSLIGTPQECRHLLVYPDDANAAINNITHDAHIRIVPKTGSSTNMMQQAVGCEYIHTMVNGHQLTVHHVAGV
jgi:hypothetical protein